VRFVDTLNKELIGPVLGNTLKSLIAAKTESVHRLDATAKSIVYAAERTGGNAPNCRRYALFCVLCHL
jgi:hypothetical protein